MDQLFSLDRLQAFISNPQGMAAVILAAVFFKATPALQTLMGSGDSGRLMSFAVVAATASLALTTGLWLINSVWDIGDSVLERMGII